MSKNKSKIVRWEYVTEPFDVFVLPSHVIRQHTPIITSLEAQKSGFYLHLNMLHLRPCVQGVDEYGAVVKYLYCTRDGRFFVRGKDGWNEILPDIRTPRSNKRGGNSGTAIMRSFGSKYCHRCVAFAWLKVPKQVISQMYGAYPMPKWEVDHLNTDHKNWSADNLQWVTADENRRRAKIARRMRQIALDPKLLTPTLCKGIYTLPEERIDEFIYKCSLTFANDPSPLTAEAIRLDVAQVLDNVKSQISNDK